MDSEQFVEALRLHVLKSAVDDTISNMISPPGRSVKAATAAKSDWFNALPAADVVHVKAAIEDAAHAAVFAFLAALDGARTIDDERGHFELRFVGRESTLLNPRSIDLHDLLGAQGH